MPNSILTSNQTSFLQQCGKSAFIIDNFYLSGGTALTEFYLHHRYSEDLDFFSEKEFDILNVDIFIKKNKEELGVSTIDFQQAYNRNMFFLSFGKDIVKTEFTYFPFPRIERGPKKYGVEIDSLLDIAVNKLFSIYQRTIARDYIDLYLICKKSAFSIADLTRKAKIKFDWHIDPLQLGTQFIKATDVQDYPRMIKDIAPKEWQNFFTTEAIALKQQIIE